VLLLEFEQRLVDVRDEQFLPKEIDLSLQFTLDDVEIEGCLYRRSRRLPRG